jgi:NADH:ubiquinone oxidoreductase subunit C
LSKLLPSSRTSFRLFSEPICKFAKEQLGFNFLSDLSSVDNFGDEPRFEAVYELYSMDSNIHLRLKTRVSEDHLEVPSVVHLWATANWHEREVYDMMGIRFTNLIFSSNDNSKRQMVVGAISRRTTRSISVIFFCAVSSSRRRG